jgi:opacity protein-like surface antigen
MTSLLRAVVALAVGVLLVLPPALAFAQDINTMPVPKVEMSAGYAFMRDMSKRELTGFDHLNFPAGWYTTGAFNPTEWLGLVGEVSGAYRNNLNFDLGQMLGQSELTGPSVGTGDVHLYTALGGVRVFRKFGRVVPFGQVLAGVVHVRTTETPSALGAEFGLAVEKTTDNNFGIQPGGGVTVYLTENLGVRAAADYRSMIDFNSGDANDYYHALRVVGGFNLQWGPR